MSHVADFFDFPLILFELVGGVTNEAEDSNLRFFDSVESNLKILSLNFSIDFKDFFDKKLNKWLNVRLPKWFMYWSSVIKSRYTFF